MIFLLSTLGRLLTGDPYVMPLPKTDLKVEIQNVKPVKGAVYIALFHPGKSFPDGKPAEGKKVDVTGNHLQATFSVEPGDYAIAVYHDENSNGKLDKRVFGIPKEPYGFSNNYRPSMSAPKFNDCKFSVSEGGKTISIKLDSF